ncbi:PAS and ANTAR domain-containing protein [Williamsia sp.]|uniref:PAS and ANTAR domain-containing protein n=1 Tax=Williamsia sp. TaxID=1872085 RepID=UPI002F92EB1B
MESDSTGAEQVGQVLGGVAQAAGSFRFLIEQQQWFWSDEVAAIHGYGPGEVTPTTELLLSHKHPDDRQRVEHVVNELLEGKTFSSRHRIIDRRGRVRHVLVIGDRMTDPSGKLIGTEGFYVDLTDAHQTEMKETMDAAVRDFAVSRAVIEQAKGMLMLTYGISADRAFEVLTWRSQQTNTKLRSLAQNIVDVVENEVPIGDETRRAFDHLLLTAHLDKGATLNGG